MPTWDIPRILGTLLCELWPRLEALADNFKYSPRELANKKTQPSYLSDNSGSTSKCMKYQATIKQLTDSESLTPSFPLRGRAVSFSQPPVLRSSSTTTGSLYRHQSPTFILRNRSASQRRVSKSLVFSYMAGANAADGAKKQFRGVNERGFQNFPCVVSHFHQ
ncbi:hypothetical protein K443DRAFT_573822 [Laccaria amethystina LaAM-08-1]|uniref:Unplaced genomic scaffold K443scaffold_74, whole genome shotgun sequence n=1 Tax=Laccaria amethystina LaAM-08-1 TaxID=1095629 RepID=A0A0C9XIA0_9AGAR|nr:hypothetical protein K443DRAFT_573822 [Laccaria amethystina LaAM-08-1]